MVPRAVQDAGYTAVGLGVLALQEVRTRRREIAQKVNTELGAAARQAQAVLGEVKAQAAPVTSRLQALPCLPGPFGAVIEEGRVRIVRVLRPTGS